MVVSKKDKKRRPLSHAIDSSVDRTLRSPYKVPSYLWASLGILHPNWQIKLKSGTGSVDANHFEYIQDLAMDDGRESILARKSDNRQVYTVKLVRKSGYGAVSLAARIRNEQAALKILTKLEVPFVLRLWWSFEDERAMYLVTVSWRLKSAHIVYGAQGLMPYYRTGRMAES